MSPRNRLYLASLVILVAGLFAATLIYLTADEAPDGAVAYVIVNGAAHAISPSASKTYVRELRRFGGKTSVLFDEFGRWFGELWVGKALAGTVAWISVFLSLGLYLFARYLLPG